MEIKVPLNCSPYCCFSERAVNSYVTSQCSPGTESRSNLFEDFSDIQTLPDVWREAEKPLKIPRHVVLQVQGAYCRDIGTLIKRQLETLGPLVRYLALYPSNMLVARWHSWQNRYHTAPQTWVRFSPWMMDFTCSPCDLVCFLRVLQFTPTSQGRVGWWPLSIIP